MLYGYGRVSSTAQSLDIQEAALKAAGCDVIRMEKMSGTTTAGRVELETLLSFMREGDTLVVTRTDRLARSALDLQLIVKRILGLKANLRFTEQPIDTSDATGLAFLGMLGVFAELETNLRKERQMEGIAAARLKGVYKGRGRSVPRAKVLELLSAEISPSVIAKTLRISRRSVYNVQTENNVKLE